MSIGRGASRWRAVLAVIAVAVSTVAVTGATPVQAATWNGFGEFLPLTPARIYSSRELSTPRPVAAAPGVATFEVPVTGQGGVPADASSVLAVAANITVTAPTVQGFLTAYPAGEAVPTSSNVNFRAGQTVPNLAVLRPGAGGRVGIALQGVGAGTAEVIIDVFGYWLTDTASARGARLVATAPGRIFDSRPSATLGAGSTVPLTIRGADASNPAVTDIVPNDPAVTAVVVNLTGINANPGSVATFVSALPVAPTGPPGTSNLNLAAGQTKANLAIVPIGPDGRIHLYNHLGRTDVAVDVVGYLRTGPFDETTAGRVLPLQSPFRAIDTRDPANGNVRLGPGQAESWDFSATIDTTCSPVACASGGTPVGEVAALLGTLTGISLVRQLPSSPEVTYVTMYPDSLPFSSNLNLGEGEDVPNLALAKLSSADVLWVYNARGWVHYAFDVAAMVLE